MHVKKRNRGLLADFLVDNKNERLFIMYKLCLTFYGG